MLFYYNFCESRNITVSFIEFRWVVADGWMNGWEEGRKEGEREGGGKEIGCNETVVM